MCIRDSRNVRPRSQGKVEVGDVERGRGVHGHNPDSSSRLLDIDRNDLSVGDRAPHEPAVQRVIGDEIGDVSTASGDEPLDLILAIGGRQSTGRKRDHDWPRRSVTPDLVMLLAGRMCYQHQMSIDIHAHCVPAEAVDIIRRDGAEIGVEVNDDGTATVAGRPLAMPLHPALSDRGARLAAMDRSGVEQQVLSPWIDFTAYRLDPDRGARWSRLLNEALAAEAASHPDRFLAIGTVPLQSPQAAATELRHAVEQLGMVGVEVGTRVGDVYLANADLDPFWEAAARLRCLVVLHPLDPLPGILSLIHISEPTRPY